MLHPQAAALPLLPRLCSQTFVSEITTMIPGNSHFYVQMFSAKGTSAAQAYALRVGAAGSSCPCLGADCTPSTFGLKEKETLPTKEKDKVLTHFHMRNALPACKMICKQENLWYLEIELLIVVLFVQFHFQLELRVL